MTKLSKALIVLAVLYLIFHIGRWFEYQYTQEAIDNAIEQRLSTCLTPDFEFIPSDWCLYGQEGYQVKDISVQPKE